MKTNLFYIICEQAGDGNVFENFIFCLKSQPYIHKYLITTFNKEYITLQWIQTSTF